MASEVNQSPEGPLTHDPWVCRWCSGGGGCSGLVGGTFPLCLNGPSVFCRSGDFATPSWTVLVKRLPCTRADVQVFKGASACPDRVLHTVTIYGSWLSDILQTWPANLTWPFCWRVCTCGMPALSMPSVAGFFLSRHLMWRCLWRHLDQVEMIEVLVVSALDSPACPSNQGFL